MHREMRLLSWPVLSIRGEEKVDVPRNLGGGGALAETHGEGSRGEGPGRAEESHDEEKGVAGHF